MTDPLSDWPRPHFKQPGGMPFLFFVICGKFGVGEPLSLYGVSCWSGMTRHQ
jgi:hypothetical protein